MSFCPIRTLQISSYNLTGAHRSWHAARSDPGLGQRANTGSRLRRGTNIPRSSTARTQADQQRRRFRPPLGSNGITGQIGRTRNLHSVLLSDLGNGKSQPSKHAIAPKLSFHQFRTPVAKSSGCVSHETHKRLASHHRPRSFPSPLNHHRVQPAYQVCFFLSYTIIVNYLRPSVAVLEPLVSLAPAELQHIWRRLQSETNNSIPNYHTLVTPKFNEACVSLFSLRAENYLPLRPPLQSQCAAQTERLTRAGASLTRSIGAPPTWPVAFASDQLRRTSTRRPAPSRVLAMRRLSRFVASTASWCHYLLNRVKPASNTETVGLWLL